MVASNHAYPFQHFYRPCVLLLALALTVASVVYYYTGALHVDRGVVATGLDEHSYEMFSVVELPGRGKGLIANRDIKVRIDALPMDIALGVMYIIYSRESSLFTKGLSL